MDIRWTFAAVTCAVFAACASSERPEPETAPPPEARTPDEKDAASEAEQEIECEGPPVELAFDWPAGLDARVKSVEAFEIRDSREEQPARQVMPTAHRLEVRERDEGRLAVRFAAAGADRPRLDGLVMAYGGERPTLVVSKEDGALVDLEGVEAMRAAHDRVSEEQDLSDEEAAEILERIRTEDLLADAQGWWKLAVSSWVGRRIGCDETQTGELEMPVKTLGGEAVPMQFEWRYLGSHPCDEESGRGGQRCAELLVVGKAESEQVRDRLEERVRAVGGPRGQKMTVKEAELVRLARLRVEPGTMLPHIVQLEEHIGSAFEAPGRQVAGRRQSDAHSLAFQYGAAEVQSEDEPGDPGGRQPREIR